MNASYRHDRECGYATLTASQTIFQQGNYNVAVANAYFALRYMIVSAIKIRDSKASVWGHGELIARFADLFSFTGKERQLLISRYNNLFSYRVRAHYKQPFHPSKELAQKQLIKAEQFMEYIAKFIAEEENKKQAN